MELNERIKAWREHVGMKLSELAKIVGVAWESAYEWETGDSKPTHDNLERIVAAFGLTMAAFWGAVPAKRRAKRGAA